MSRYDDAVNAAINDLKRRKNPSSGAEPASESSYSDEKTYGDKPLLFAASKMDNYAAPEYLEMRRLERLYEARYKPVEWLFVKQARSMENFEDDYDFDGDFSRAYPMYKDMTLVQLRGYFSWRKRLRAGVYDFRVPSFGLLYLFELINLIGCSSELDGYEKLCDFSGRFLQSTPSPTLTEKLGRWKRDFVIYYRLGLPANGNHAAEQTEQLVCAFAREDTSSEELFRLLAEVCEHDLRASPVYKASPEDLTEVTARVIRAILRQLTPKEGIRLLLGDFHIRYYRMFDGAAFYETQRREDTVRKLSEIESFTCADGKWTHAGFELSGAKLKALSSILRNIDSALRDKTGCKRKLKRRIIPLSFDETIDRTIREYYEEKEEKSRPVVDIDVSVLGSIRKAAEQTQKKLIVDENELSEVFGDEEKPIEAREKAQPTMPEPTVEAGETEKAEETEDGLLTEDERQVLKLLLSGGDTEGFCRKNGQMLSVLCDSINDKLFDRFADTVIEYADAPAIVEDYADELEEMFQ